MTAQTQDYCLIPLTQGQFAKVSPHRWEELSERSWHALWHARKRSFYAKTNICENGIWRVVHMSRMIMEVLNNRLVTVDHINGDSLDNRDENLRVCVAAKNAKNRLPQIGGRSRYKGVNWDTHRGKGFWRSRITVDGKTIHLGRFDCEQEAARAYDAAARTHFGEFAHLNFPS